MVPGKGVAPVTTSAWCRESFVIATRLGGARAALGEKRFIVVV
jgi:hypothetical protein